MPPNTPAGGIDDVVAVTLAGQEVVIAESYHVRAGLFAQPMSFTIRLGWGNVARTLLQMYPPGTPFTLSINGVLQFSGIVDRIHATDDPGATALEISGRDVLAPMVRSRVAAEKNFTDSTYSGLVQEALNACGLGALKLYKDSTASRKARAGAKIIQTAATPDVDAILSDQVRIGVVHTEIKAKLGESWMTFVRRYLDRAGLVLYGTEDGNACITTPQINQQPIYSIVRGRKDLTTVQTANTVTVERASFMNDVTERHTEALIYGRGGGKAFGRTKSKGEFVDDEMFNLGFQNQPIVHRDANVQTRAQAEYLSRRILADERRTGYQLVYTVTGHTCPALTGGGRAVWTFDAIASVQDDEYGLTGPFYLEAVEYKGDSDSGRTSVLHLSRPTDIVLGDPEDL